MKAIVIMIKTIYFEVVVDIPTKEVAEAAREWRDWQSEPWDREAFIIEVAHDKINDRIYQGDVDACHADIQRTDYAETKMIED